jgi:hypothetical protein
LVVIEAVTTDARGIAGIGSIISLGICQAVGVAVAYGRPAVIENSLRDAGWPDIDRQLVDVVAGAIVGGVNRGAALEEQAGNEKHRNAQRAGEENSTL